MDVFQGLSPQWAYLFLLFPYNHHMDQKYNNYSPLLLYDLDYYNMKAKNPDKGH